MKELAKSDEKFQDLLIAAVRAANARSADAAISKLLETSGAVSCASCGLLIERSANPNEHCDPVCVTCFEIDEPFVARPYWNRIASDYHQDLARKRRLIEGDR